MGGLKGFHIASIEKADFSQPRFVWVDEDKKQVSPVHRDLRTALNFISGWQSNYDRVRKHEEEIGREIPALKQLTKTGKPPVALQRVKIDITIEDLTADEQRLVEVMKS